MEVFDAIHWVVCCLLGFIWTNLPYIPHNGSSVLGSSYRICKCGTVVSSNTGNEMQIGNKIYKRQVCSAADNLKFKLLFIYVLRYSICICILTCLVQNFIPMEIHLC